jgi:hypothetical protein
MVRAARRALLFVALLFAALLFVALLTTRAAAYDIDLPAVNPDTPISVQGEQASRWQEGSYEVWLIERNFRLEQGPTVAKSDQAVIWVERGASLEGRLNKLIVYLEGNVEVSHRGEAGSGRVTDNTFFGRFFSSATVNIQIAAPAGAPATKPEVFQRAVARRGLPTTPVAATALHRTQFTQFQTQETLNEVTPPGTRRLRAFRRSNVPFTIESMQNPAGNETVTVIDRGVILIIEGVVNGGLVDVSTNRIVIWQGGSGPPDLSGQQLQASETPLEIYMEGDIVFRQGDRVIYADRMYYDVRNQVGTIVAAEMLSPLPNLPGLADVKVKLKADLIQQLGPDRFLAQNAYVTSSRLGDPGYRLQSGEIFYEDKQQPMIDPYTGNPVINPVSNEQVVAHERLLTSRNNFLYAGPVPVFYWPRFATNLEDPTLYIRRVRFKNDQIFGTQLITEWDGFQLLGWDNPPDGMRLDLSLDYLSMRGFGYGPTLQYDRENFLGLVPGRYHGFTDSWAIKDHGTDDLGADRLDVPLEATYRFRSLARHRHELPGGWRLTGEFGWISDRNFLEQYFEREWDELKDESTGLELKKLVGTQSWNITADVRLNPFFTETQWLPRFDHFWLGQSLLGDSLSYFEHTSVGYGSLLITSTPTDPVDLAKFEPLPWMVKSKGERLTTRHEVDAPFSLGPVKVVPYALGEFAHWGEDLTGTSLDRLYGQAGVRASVPVWSVNPDFESQLFNVHGVSHKMVLSSEFLVAQSNQNLDLLPLYDQVDDNAIEWFRIRDQFNLWGSPPPPLRFDERFYALRYGMGGVVTSPSAEIADDLIALRTGLHQRWQTKRGRPGNRRIIDWITFDTNASFFPRPARDDFGEPFGLVDYDFRWHVGDRFTMLSDGAFDFFDQGIQTASVGGFLSRPPRGSLYTGLRFLDGPYEMKVLTAAYAYRMGPKWSSSVGASLDLVGKNIGQYATLTRIGESLLLTAGFIYDVSKDNVGINLTIQPRFMPSSVKFGTVPGPTVPLAGVYGLE